MKEIIIRPETENDYRTVENLTRESFWNQYVPGCNEHYLVHMMRSHIDFVPELDFVLELDGEIIGNIMYTVSKLTDESGFEKNVLTFGPLSVHPAHQRHGYSRMLIDYSFEKAADLGYDTVVIFGTPCNYISRGFRSCRRYNVSLENDIYPSALLVKELREGVLNGKKWVFTESSVSDCLSDTDAFEQFESSFPPKEKAFKPSQEEFYIHSHSCIVR